MITKYDLADFCGTSVQGLDLLAEQLKEGKGFSTLTYATYHQGRRVITVPMTYLDSVTKNLHRRLTSVLPYSPPDHVHGFIKGRSTLTNATPHLDQSCVLRVDLQDFFPTINRDRIYETLRRQGLNTDAANLCTGVVTIDGRLPTGLGTSPLLSNLVFETTDQLLLNYCANAGLNFTRYVDDMTFSGCIVDQNLEDITRILASQDWLVNARKTAFMRRGGPQYVTGLYVGCAEGPRIPRRIKRQMRRICFLIERFGYDDYMQEYGGNEAEMIPNRLYGWARYITAVEPNVGQPMLRLLRQHVPEDNPHSHQYKPSKYPPFSMLKIIQSSNDLANP